MKFAHLSDIHLGFQKHEALQEIEQNIFEKTLDECISRKVDFILIPGDMFHVNIPEMRVQKYAFAKFKQVHDAGIPVYVVYGSHDFSPVANSVIDLLAETGYITKVTKVKESTEEKITLDFLQDEKTQTKIVGLPGLKQSKDREYYEKLDRTSLESESDFKIFVFHGGISEMKSGVDPGDDYIPLSLLPKNFDYYAGGHVHIVKDISLENYKNIVYPGPLFPNNFAELEKLERGGFYIYDNGQLRYEPITIKNHEHIELDCNHLTPEQVKVELLGKVKDKEFINTIVSLRLKGTLESGKVSDIDFKEIYRIIYGKGAYFLMKNTNALKTKEFEEIKIDTKNIDELEDSIIKEHLGQVSFLEREKEITLTKELITHLNTERKEGERVTDFEKRLLTEVDEMLVSNN